jgi:hypothetical protein
MKQASVAVLVILFLAGCAGTALRLTKESSQELSGCYVLANDRENSPFLLQLNPDMTYIAYVMRGLNVWAKATGSWYIEDGVLVFGQSRETSGWHHYMQEYQVYRRKSGLLIDGGRDVKLVKSPQCSGA